MSKNLENKKVVVEEIKSKIQNAKSVVIVNYNGITVAEDTELRQAFRKSNVEYKVLKNTLIRRAFDDLGVKDFDNDLNGTTAVAFGSDEVSAAKVVAEYSKKYNDKITAKSAYLDGTYMDKNGVIALSKVPSKIELIGCLAGALNNIIGGLAIALNQVSEQKANA